ncbi:hypothetical protein NB466_17825 [Vibrio fluvialis]|uniref:hypothetical protein n=1 Tax=Vibrio fluvialis TaxID=676 RepID=UPI00215D0AD5|nr:hypothetical protein [Vibrio fluvialis]EKO3454326.1 hypothetical protein [Vibrio fluvialis]MCR9300712.1 hypothetical protein [Vibrio fluvialis]
MMYITDEIRLELINEIQKGKQKFYGKEQKVPASMQLTDHDLRLKISYQIAKFPFKSGVLVSAVFATNSIDILSESAEQIADQLILDLEKQIK